VPTSRLAGVAVASGRDPGVSRRGGGAGAQPAQAIEGVERCGRSSDYARGASQRVAAGSEEVQVETQAFVGGFGSYQDALLDRGSPSSWLGYLRCHRPQSELTHEVSVK
jgi:hypothetical protein